MRWLVIFLALGCDSNPPLAQSAWPKFRRDLEQTGRSPLRPRAGGKFWSFPTGNGIFSSPVIGGDGTIYVGSADRSFYALRPDGSVRWQAGTGEIIDSAALLDDRGRVYFGSGDGKLRALDARDGSEIWKWEAPSTAILNWFEGNVAIGRDGTLYVPNDDYQIFALDRSGKMKWSFQTPDQTWSLPAVDDSGVLYFGNNNVVSFLGDNTFSLDPAGHTRWSTSVKGSIAASPLVWNGSTIVGAFDGYVRAYDAKSGNQKWSFATRDHLYASPALLDDHTVVQAGADGSVYALSLTTGELEWQYDTLAPIRSSPAIDGDGNSYFGNGEGRLYSLDKSGHFRWAAQLVDDPRRDVNSSPALGSDAVYVGAESGQLFSVPYDLCPNDPRCVSEPVLSDGAQLYFTSDLGAISPSPPSQIDANASLAFTLMVRESGRTKLAVIDSATTNGDYIVSISGDRRFLSVTPKTKFTDGHLTISGSYLVDPDRDGLRTSGGKPGGSFAATFDFTVANGSGNGLTIPTTVGDAASTFELSRLAAPLPTILPSYNQIGFDSLHYLVGLVEGTPDHAIGWLAGARVVEGATETTIDPATQALFPVEVTLDQGLLTLRNSNGFRLVVMNLTLPLGDFRVNARLDQTIAGLQASTICGQVPVYGPFLQQLGFCNPQTDTMQVFGAANLTQLGTRQPPEAGEVAFTRDATTVTATLSGSTLRADEHSLAILLIDAASGAPLSLDYGLSTSRTENADGTIATVTLTLPSDRPLPPSLRAYLMVDVVAAARAML